MFSDVDDDKCAELVGFPALFSDVILFSLFSGCILACLGSLITSWISRAIKNVMLSDYMALIREGKDDYYVTELYYDAETDV